VSDRALAEALAELAEVAAQWKRLAEWEREQRKPRLVWSRPKEQALTPRQACEYRNQCTPCYDCACEAEENDEAAHSRLTTRQKLAQQLEQEFSHNPRMTIPGGLRIDDLRAAAQTDEEPFLLVRRKAG